jgi:hypothetical protein
VSFMYMRFRSCINHRSIKAIHNLGIGGGSVGGSGGPNWGRTASSASPKRKEEPKKGRAGDKIKAQSHKST